jgi:hypothetical protein
MKKQTHKPIDFGNPLRSLVGNCYCEKKPTNKKIIEEILEGLSRGDDGKYYSTAWAPVAEVKNGKAVAYKIIFEQCPGACGHVWNIVVKDKNVANWVVNEINRIRQIKRK